MASERSDLYGRIAVWLSIIGTTALAVFAAAYWLNFSTSPISNSPTDWGTFGDYIGGIAGTVLAFLTLLALAASLRLQAKELENTRKALERQNAENTFFRLLANRQQVLAQMRYTSGNTGDVHGRYALAEIVKIILRAVLDSNSAIHDHPESWPFELGKALHKYRNTLDPHVGSTMQLLRYALATKADVSDLSFFAIARADFSASEQALLVVIGLSDYGQQFGAREVIRDSGILGGLNPLNTGFEISPQLVDAYTK